MTRRQFDESGHPCNPLPLDSGKDGDAWYYVQHDGIIVCTDGCKHCGQQRSSIRMSWSAVKLALMDHEKAKGRR